MPNQYLTATLVVVAVVIGTKLLLGQYKESGFIGRFVGASMFNCAIVTAVTMAAVRDIDKWIIFLAMIVLAAIMAWVAVRPKKSDGIGWDELKLSRLRKKK